MDRFRANSMEAQLRAELKTRRFQGGWHLGGDFGLVIALIIVPEICFNLRAWKVWNRLWST
jgi:hypothetical protein